MKLQVCIVDDHLPLRDDVDDGLLIPGSSLRGFLEPGTQWRKEEVNLGTLLRHLLESDSFKSGKLDVSWARSPAICLNAIAEGYTPDLVVFDWMYDSSFGMSVETAFMKILELTKSTVFIFSAEPEDIPGQLFAHKLEWDRKRVRLFLKGSPHGIMTADEIISNWVEHRLDGTTTLVIEGRRVTFVPSKSLSDPLDLVYLKDITCASNLQHFTASLGTRLGAEEVRALLDRDTRMLLESEDGYLVNGEETSLAKEYNATSSITLGGAFNKYGLVVVWRVIQEGVASVK